jgi:eukaryotic-like serine/threonine-protein kinase
LKFLATPRIEPMDTTLARPPIGQLLDGRYRVESLIARGGMATVYLGTDTRLERTVALKIMHAELANDEDFVRRFVGEARSVAQLSHPNVVTVYDQGADGHSLYLAMEYVPGRTLRDLLNSRGRLSPHEALDVMAGVLGGLAAAHDAGIAHRDVKPENVLLNDSGAIKVADFGLARLLTGVSQTKSGMIIGTAAYLAPEQVAGQTADARTDVYAAGVMLFELLTGRQPHTGDTPLAVAYKHVNEVVPPPSSAVPGLPPALDALVALATSRDPELRPGDAGQFLDAVTGVRQSLPPDGAPAPAADGLSVRPAGDFLDPPAGGFPVPAGSGFPAAPPTGSPALPGSGSAASPTTVMPGQPEGDPGREGGGTRPAGPAPPLLPWPGPSPGQPGHDLMPGVGPPARQSFGLPHPGSAPQSVTQRFQPEPHRPGDQHTLIVSGGDDGSPYGPQQQTRYGPPEPRLQRLLFSRRLGYLAAAVAVVLVVGLATWWLTSGRYTDVPKVTGITVAAATAELREAGFTVTTGTARLDNQFAKGQVIRSVPAAGQRVGKGSHITLVPSAGPHRRQMPQVTGLTLEAAQAALRQAGLTPGSVTKETSGTIAAGIVVSTTPVAGAMWPQPQPVRLVVSAGPPVPDFVGQPQEAAQGWASANGVSLDVRTAAKSDEPAGTVTHQSVAPGSAFTRGQVITITISPGPPMVKVPNVDGLPVDRATRLLQERGFSVNVNQVGPLDNVFNYSPSDQAPKGSTITIWVGL